MSLPAKKPAWLRVPMPGGGRYHRLKETFRELELATVCEEARCPNIGECWGEGTATIMILGDTCTRGCRFCSVQSGNPRGVVDRNEPTHVASALSRMDLAYVVVTMVDRDDLDDGGAAHTAEVIARTRSQCPDLLLEALVGDYDGRRADVETVVRDGAPHVFAHNVEVVPRLQRSMRDARCGWERSLDVLRWAKAAGAGITKSSLMVGCGEEESEVVEALAALRDAEVDVVTIGQYLRPTPKHAPVQRYVTPEEFARYREAGLAMGFDYVASGPLVRSSYKAAEAYLQGVLRGKPAHFDSVYGRAPAKRHLQVVS